MLATAPFVWKSVPDADSYGFQISESSGFEVLLRDTASLEDTTFRYNLANERKYFWRVNAANAGGKSPWSGVCSLTTRMAMPATVALKAPVSGGSVTRSQIALVWSKSAPRISRYRLNLALDNRFTDMQIDSLLVDTATVVRDLQDGYTYWWRIQAQNEEGWGEWSQPGFFLVMLSPTQALPENALDASPGLTPGNGTISYRLPFGTPVSIRVHDMQGKTVFSRTHLYQPAGRHGLSIDAVPGNTHLMLEFKAGIHVKNIRLPLGR